MPTNAILNSKVNIKTWVATRARLAATIAQKKHPDHKTWAEVRLPNIRYVNAVTDTIWLCL